MIVHKIWREPMERGEPWIGAVYSGQVCWTVASLRKRDFFRKLEDAHQRMTTHLSKVPRDELVHGDHHLLSMRYSDAYMDWWRLGNLDGKLPR